MLGRCICLPSQCVQILVSLLVNESLKLPQLWDSQLALIYALGKFVLCEYYQPVKEHKPLIFFGSWIEPFVMENVYSFSFSAINYQHLATTPNNRNFRLNLFSGYMILPDWSRFFYVCLVFFLFAWAFMIFTQSY